MAFDFEWHSASGALTDDNRDYCGIAERQDAALYAIVDGATRGPHGGELARDLVCRLVDGFIAMDAPVTEDAVCDLLRQAHRDLRRQYAADSASYLIALAMEEGALTALYAGDCRLGRVVEGQAVHWLTGVHTLANATEDLPDAALSVHPNRHILTRSFRAREFQQPECAPCDLTTGDTLLLATDGFWAEMDTAIQAAFIKGHYPDSAQNHDDISCLVLRPGTARTADDTGEQENIYIRSGNNTP